MEKYKLLIINPGSTSTKLAVFEDENCLFEINMEHPKEDLIKFKDILSQKDFRVECINNWLKSINIKFEDFSAIIARGGITKPLNGGTYKVDEDMLKDLEDKKSAKHPSSLAGIIANEISKKIDKPSYTVDPVVTDELEPIARISGFSEIPRISIFHALNQKAVARKCALENGKKYEDLKFIVAHMGGGISVGAHKYGRVIDVNEALKGEGPFSPERSGSLPVSGVVDLCYSNKYTKDELIDLLIKKGGMLSYLGTNDGKKVDNMIKNGDTKAQLIFEAMAYQVSKEIGALSTVLLGKVDYIILTGGLAYNTKFVGYIKDRVSFIADVKVYEGEMEMQALALGGLRVLRGEEKALKY